MLGLFQSRLVHLIVILALALVVRGLTANFIHEHLSQPAWFQAETYAHFDRQAEAILDRTASVFWIDDPTRTDAAVYPPGYAIWVAGIYKLTGLRYAGNVQSVQWVLDSWSVLLIVGIAFHAYNWRVAVAAGVMAALSPLLALSGASPMADAPTSWVVLGGVWLLLLGVKRQSLLLALGAGALAGLSCWLRGNAILLPLFWAMAIVVIQKQWESRLTLAGLAILGSLLFVTPLLVRNAVAFRAFTPGLGVGTNLWEGIGETSRAAEFGAVYGDQALLEQERVALGVAPETPFGLYHPDGVKRDRERARKATTVIRKHPVWYAGVMLRRMAGVLKFAGKPAPYYGSSGINVTSRKCLPPERQGGVLTLLVTPLGMVQSVMRHLALPLMLVGIWFAMRGDWRITLLLLSTVLYYLVAGSALHTEFRYGLPMQALLFVFAGVGIDRTSELIGSVVRKSRQMRTGSDSDPVRSSKDPR